MAITKSQALAFLSALGMSKELKIHFDSVLGINSIPSLEWIQSHNIQELEKLLESASFQTYTERMELMHTIERIKRLSKYFRNFADIFEVDYSRDLTCSQCTKVFTQKEQDDNLIVEMSFLDSGRKFRFHQTCFVEIAGDRFL